MQVYYYKQWEIFTKEELPLSKISHETATHKLYLYRANMNQSMMVSLVPPATLGEVHPLSLDLLYDSAEDAHYSAVSVNMNWFEHKFGKTDIESILSYLEGQQSKKHTRKKATLLALGDVGGTLAIGLKLLGGHCIDSLGICDISEAQTKRWEMELNQITVNPDLRIKAIDLDALFEGDIFIFCASKFVPKVGDDVKDVRMIQYEENSKLISFYAKMARDKGFKGIFAVVSDPVDLLCRKVFEASNQNEDLIMDYQGLLPEQVVGFGLGVMDGRAKYYSDLMGLDYRRNGRVFGPHGKDLVVATNIDDENQETALELTSKVVTANLEVRELGFKPYIAPALSSGAHSIILFLSGESQYTAHFVGGVYWGTRNRLSDYGVELERIKLSHALKARVQKSFEKLEATWQELNV